MTDTLQQQLANLIAKKRALLRIYHTATDSWAADERCSFPACGCAYTPAAIRAAIAALFEVKP